VGSTTNSNDRGHNLVAKISGPDYGQQWFTLWIKMALPDGKISEKMLGAMISLVGVLTMAPHKILKADILLYLSFSIIFLK
jgi:hypothetical protein